MSFTSPPSFTTRPDLSGTFGMAASTHWIATASAQAVLERGGNAFDAATAAAFVLHVVEPHLNGPGGDLTAVIQAAEDEAPRILVGQGPAPAGATIEHYRAEGLDLVPGSGALAAAVPGAVDAWLLLLRDHGTWELSDVLAFAIGYARDGHPVLPNVVRTIAGVAGLFRDHWPSSAERWLPDGRIPEPGEVIRNTAYAGVLEALAAAAGGEAEQPGTATTPHPGVRARTNGRTDSSVHAPADGRAARIDAARARWRELLGRAAEDFVQTPHRHSDGGEHAGVLTAADVEGFSASYEDPVTATFRGYTIAKTGPWGQGPALLQTLKILEGLDDERLDPSTEPGAHTIAEALKLAFADREAWYGDGLEPDALAQLLSDEYAAERRALIGETASHEQRPGTIPGRPAPAIRPVHAETGPSAAGVGEPTVPSARPAAASDAPLSRRPEISPTPDENAGSDPVFAESPAPGAGSPPSPESAASPAPRTAASAGPSPVPPDLETDANGVARGDTCHIDVVDRWGNIVSATPSGGWLQSSPTIPALGFCLGTRLQMTWLDEASPSALRPGERPRTTLTPTLVLRDGEPIIALGSPGGDQQDQWQLLFLLRVLVGGWTPQQAIDAPALHTTSFPGSFWPRTGTPGGLVVEDRLGDDVIRGLERRGHIVTRAGDWALGRLSAVTRDPASGLLGAAANPRGAQGYATGR